MWPFNKGPSKAQLRFLAEQTQRDLEHVSAMLNRVMADRDAMQKSVGQLQFNLGQLQKEKAGNLPPPVITVGIPQGHDPRDDLPTDVVKLQKALDAAKRNFATKCVQYDELDNEAAKTFEQMGTKLATAMHLLTPAKKREYAKRLAEMGWGEPINYEKDTL